MSDPRYVQVVDSLRLIATNPFEDFCAVLTDYEVFKRFGKSNVSGAPRQFFADGGTDIFVYDFPAPPMITTADYQYSIVPDSGPVCVCCKSGDNYESGLLSDLDKKGAIDAVKAGGSVVCATNVKIGYKDKKKLEADLTAALSASSGISEQLLHGRVRLIDANHIQSFISHHSGLNLPDQFQQILQIPDTPGVFSYETWKQKNILDQDRGWPDYVADEQRERAISTIKGALQEDVSNNTPRAIWVNGPPGVGKTRLVAEAIEASANGPRRVFAAIGSDFGNRAVSQYPIAPREDAVLIIDETPPIEVGDLSSTFIARGMGHNSVVIFIGPAHETSINIGNQVNTIDVRPMEDSAIRSLVDSELPPGTPELNDRVIRLVGGYPWYAILIAKELRGDPDALPEGATNWDAAKLALVGSSRFFDGSGMEWEQQVNERARVLFSVLLTEELNWDDLDLMNQISEFTGVSPQDSKEQMFRLHGRGVIRQNEDFAFKYVTPNILAREVATHLLSSPQSMGPLAKKIFPERTAELLTLLDRLEVPPSLLEQFVNEEIDELPSSIGLKKKLDQRLLSFSARQNPAGVAKAILSSIELESLDSLRADTVNRRALIFALEHISHRKKGFEDAEAALFKLALSENETWGNNARNTWSNLFGAVLHLTHRDFGTRFNILKHRFEHRTDGEEELLRSGLESSMGLEQSSVGYSDDDKIDGEWQIPNNREVRIAKLQAWEFFFLVAGSADDISPYVEILAKNIHAVTRWGIASQVFDLIQNIAPALDSHQKSQLRQALGAISKNLPVDSIEQTTYAKSFNALKRTLAAERFSDRLYDLVGTWTPNEESIDLNDIENSIRKLDEKLVSESIQNPSILLSELDWLDSDKAVRASQFMFRLGKLDNSQIFITPLIDMARNGSGRDLLSGYLSGLADLIDANDFHAILANMRTEPILRLNVFDSVSRTGLNDETVEWIIEDLQAGIITSNDVTFLQYGRRTSELSDQSLFRLVEFISGLQTKNAIVTALNMLMDSSSNDSAIEAKFKSLHLDLLSDLSLIPITGMDEHTWERASMQAIDDGNSARVAQLCLELINLEDHGYFGQSAWKVLKAAILNDSAGAWIAVSRWLDTADELDEYRFSLGTQEPKLIDDFEFTDVVDWIGDSINRAVRIARMVSAHESPLNDLARWLLISFGPNAEVADALTSRAHSTPGAMWGPISNFAKSQMELASEWANDPDINVATWGAERKIEFERSYAADLAREEHRDLRRS